MKRISDQKTISKKRGRFNTHFYFDEKFIPMNDQICHFQLLYTYSSSHSPSPITDKSHSFVFRLTKSIRRIPVYKRHRLDFVRPKDLKLSTQILLATDASTIENVKKFNALYEFSFRKSDYLIEPDDMPDSTVVTDSSIVKFIVLVIVVYLARRFIYQMIRFVFMRIVRIFKRDIEVFQLLIFTFSLVLHRQFFRNMHHHLEGRWRAIS
jgi:hypothetical protein